MLHKPLTSFSPQSVYIKDLNLLSGWFPIVARVTIRYFNVKLFFFQVLIIHQINVHNWCLRLISKARMLTNESTINSPLSPLVVSKIASNDNSSSYVCRLIFFSKWKLGELNCHKEFSKFFSHKSRCWMSLHRQKSSTPRRTWLGR